MVKMIRAAGDAKEKEIRSLKDVPDEQLFAGGHSACKACGGALCAKLITKALGKNTVVVNGSGCMTLLPLYPLTPFRVPWIHCAIENAGATASGVRRGLDRKGKKDANVVVHAGDGATYDIGLQSFSGMLERGDRVIYVCYNNQSFANTGAQKCGSTPYGARTATTPPGARHRLGKENQRKSLAKIAAAHDIPYVATASPAYPIDFLKKLQKAAKIDGPSLIEYLFPCIPGWGCEEENAIGVARLSVLSGCWPLFEIENGKFTLNVREKTKQVSEYLSAQARFSHLTGKDIAAIQAAVDMEWSALLKGDFFRAREY